MTTGTIALTLQTFVIRVTSLLSIEFPVLYKRSLLSIFVCLFVFVVFFYFLFFVFLLSILYAVVCICQSGSYNLSPLPIPSGNHSLFFISVTLFLFCK